MIDFEVNHISDGFMFNVSVVGWTVRHQLEDFKFADDLSVLSRRHEQMQVNKTGVAEVSESIGL